MLSATVIGPALDRSARPTAGSSAASWAPSAQLWAAAWPTPGSARAPVWPPPPRRPPSPPPVTPATLSQVTCDITCQLCWTITIITGSKCYRVVSSSANYLQAILGCVSLGASLATVSSQAEQDAVFALTGASGAWIGLTDFLNEGTFSWVDESPVTFTKWRVNQPNNGNNNQHCTQVSLMVE